MEEVEGSSVQLAKLAEQLNGLVHQFKLQDSDEENGEALKVE